MARDRTTFAFKSAFPERYYPVFIVLIRTIREPPGHQRIKTTVIDSHVLKHGGHYVRSPVDMLCAGTLSDTGILSSLDKIPLDFFI